MQLEKLHIIHLKKNLGGYEYDSPESWRCYDEALYIETCQRILWLLNKKPQLLTSMHLMEAAPEVLHGVDAYAFLLRVAAGLESAIKGETEVFGQIKEGWQVFEKCHPSVLMRDLRSLMQNLFRDVKVLRRDHLHGIGGTSYGSLARKIVAPLKYDSVLLMGAGQLARSVAPFMAKSRLWIWNRNKNRLGALVETLRAREGTVEIESLPDGELADAFQKVNHVVICTPVDTERESRCIEARKKGSQKGVVLHLGGTTEETRHWEGVADFYSLSDVLKLQESQNEIRAAKIGRARDACMEIARRRGLSRVPATPRRRKDSTVAEL